MKTRLTSGIVTTAPDLGGDTERAQRREFGTLRLRGRTWWVRYRVDGVVHEESSRSKSKRKAEELLAQRKAQLGIGAFTAPRARRVGFDELVQMLRQHYHNRGLRSDKRMEGGLAHIVKAFGSRRAMSITPKNIRDYTTDRLEKAAASTVNYELALLRQAFNLAVEDGLIPAAPKITISAAKNARSGYFEPEDFDALYKELPPDLKPLIQFAYLTGWRTRDEIQPLTWDRVDFRAGEVRLDPNTTKNDEGRTFPFSVFPDLAELLRRQRDVTDALEHSTGKVIPFVFHRNGVPIKDFYAAWHSACLRAEKTPTADSAHRGRKLADRIPHDFRRTAVRNLERAGVSRSIAMKLTGHKTEAVYRRYAISSGADLREGVAKLATMLATDQNTSGTVGFE